ncbi:MAG: hypothetical protein II892_03755 [Fibrobacter sp.]|jgi:hypothetical protein|nr:hypothetical protein [Fibrobacter sp.]
MKQIILSIVFFGVLLANAQEMDTTFVVNEQGQTIGVIHEKGTVPVIPQQQQTNDQIQVPPAQQANPAFGYDSTEFYMGMINKYTESGNKTRRIGKGMMLGGGIGAGLGLILFAIGAQEGSCDTDAYGNETCQVKSDGLAATGVIVMITGASVFGAGTIVKLIGSSKIRRAIRYEDRLQKYKMKQQYSMKLRFDPLIDPINKKAGANLAMEF